MSLNGTSIPEFQDFVTATKAHKITPSTEILNECAKRTYFLARMLKGRGNEEIVQSGSKIIDQVQTKKHNAAGFYRPNQNLQPRGMDTLLEISAPWRFHQGNYAWTEQQIKLQLASGGSVADIYTKLKNTWEQAALLNIWDSMEEALWDTPSAAEMEAAGGLLPYSIPCFLTDDGLAPAGFTTLSGVNVTNEPKYRNQTDTFDWSDRETGDAMFKSMDRMWRKLRWRKISGFNNQVGSPGTNFDGMVIATTSEGVDGYQAALRGANDRLRAPGKRDAGYGDQPVFNNIPFEDVERLDEVTTPGTPPFYWIDFEYLFPVYHGDTFMEEVGPIRGSINQPFSWAVYKNTYYNLFCRSRRRLGKQQTTA